MATQQNFEIKLRARIYYLAKILIRFGKKETVLFEKNLVFN